MSGPDPARRAHIVRALHDYAARYGGPAAPGGGGPEAGARYVIEGHVPDSTPQEWDWAYNYLLEHPEVLTARPKTDHELVQERQQRAARAQELAADARAAFDVGELGRARELIDEASDLDPARQTYWARIRGVIEEQAHHSAEDTATDTAAEQGRTEIPAASNEAAPDGASQPTVGSIDVSDPGEASELVAPAPVEATAPQPAERAASDDPERYPDAAVVPVSSQLQGLLRMRINDVLTGDHLDDDGLGGYVAPDGTLRVHDKAAMLATIRNEFDIYDDNLRGGPDGRGVQDPEMRPRWRREEQLWKRLEPRVEALPDTAVGQEPSRAAPHPEAAVAAGADEAVPAQLSPTVYGPGTANDAVGDRFLADEELDFRIADLRELAAQPEGVFRVSGPNPRVTEAAARLHRAHIEQFRRGRLDIGQLTDTELDGLIHAAHDGRGHAVMSGAATAAELHRTLITAARAEQGAPAAEVDEETFVVAFGQPLADARSSTAAINDVLRELGVPESDELAQQLVDVPTSDAAAQARAYFDAALARLSPVAAPQAGPARDRVAQTVAALREGRPGMHGGSEWSAAISAMPVTERRRVLAQLGFDELDAMLEPAMLADDRAWRDELIARVEQVNPEIGRLARSAARKRDAPRDDPPPPHAAEPGQATGIDAPTRLAGSSEPAPSETTPAAPTPASQFRPGWVRPPSGLKGRLGANLTALRTLRDLGDPPELASLAQKEALGCWSGWGAIPEVFDRLRDDLQWAREELEGLLDGPALAAARSSVLNAHYTDPDLVDPIWSALGRLGFTGGRVLEPGCGTGNFLGSAPPGAELTGVEIEPTTAAIARALYPQAEVLTESFADTRASHGSFDLVVGNVPFAKLVLNDRLHNGGRHSIHNHFIIKGLHLTAPGGLVAVITSRYTLDSQNPAARREMAELADLVGAVRLPKAAHQRAAGTQVVTDLLVFRRREPDREPEPFDWELTRTLEVDGHEVQINSYFADRPEMMCGRLSAGSGQYGAAEPTVVSERPAAEALDEVLGPLVEQALPRGLTHAPAPELVRARPAALVGADTQLDDGHILVEGDEFRQVAAGAAEPFEVPRSRRSELRALLDLRDTTTALLAAEAETFDHRPEIEELRTNLNQRYDAYVGRHGPINRFKWRRTGRTDPDTGEEIQTRAPDRLGGFRADPRAPLVLALEQFDAATGVASKADVFSQRVVAPRAPARGAESPADALAICMDVHGRVDLAEIADLLGVGEDEARQGLGQLVFADPDRDGALVPAAEYLSGNVRQKLERARAVAAEDPLFEPNLEALAEVVPPDLAPEDIVARLGAPWIEARYVEQFLREVLDDPRLSVEHLYATNWTVDGDDFSVTATSTWGTERYPATELAQALLQQRSITVYDEFSTTSAQGNPTTRRVLNPSATVAAQAKADELGDRFGEWLWEDPQRSIELARVYNDTFNSLVLRNYDDVELSLPGLALTFKPATHQVAAVARMISEPAVGLYHEVGAGKTAEMAIGVMELRRLNMVRKPAIVIPNHMIEQWSREFQQLYPRARVLAASSEDLKKDRRREFVARVATNDWDAVIMTRTAFERISMSAEHVEAYLNGQLSELEEALERQRASGEGRPQTLKRMQQQLETAKERIKDRLDKDYDPAVTFEASGIDYVVIDEAHDFKNLRTPSSIAGAQIDGSGRASDLDMKLHYLRAEHGQRVVTLATATPIANSITEAHVMQRYLRPDLLKDAGVLQFDAWAATFGRTVTDVELSPDGASFRMKARFARFHNVPELLRMWWLSGDVKTAEDLNLPRPELLPRPEDGQRAPRSIVVPATEGHRELIAELGKRAELVQSRAVDKDVDNMLLISSHGRSGALDLRLLGRDAPEGESKVDTVADNIAAIWREHRDDRFVGADGEPHPQPGALQFVFCDLGTPSTERWNVYDELRDQLVVRGLPRAQIRFVHEAKNDRQKGELFLACRNGDVAVLVGSTGKMGVGTNAQTRAVALHHVDCPWRPADIAQRDGRALRRGNQYDEIGIYRYVVEGTFDAYMWQAVSRKATFIAQVMNGKLGAREIDGDVGDAALSYTEVKALAAGNPLLLEKAAADAELTKLERLERTHLQTRDRMRYTIEQNERRAPVLERHIEGLGQALAARTDTRGDKFVMTVGTNRTTDRTDAGRAVLNQLVPAVNGPETTTPTRLTEVARLGGLTFDAEIWTGRMKAGYQLQISGLERGGAVDGSRNQLLEVDQHGKPSSLVVRMENLLGGLEKRLTTVEAELQRCRSETASATTELDKPFARADELNLARTRVQEIDDQMNELAAPPADADASSSPDGPAEPDGGHEADTVSSPEDAPAASRPTPGTHPASAAAAALAPVAAPATVGQPPSPPARAPQQPGVRDQPARPSPRSLSRPAPTPHGRHG